MPLETCATCRCSVTAVDSEKPGFIPVHSLTISLLSQCISLNFPLILERKCWKFHFSFLFFKLLIFLDSSWEHIHLENSCSLFKIIPRYHYFSKKPSEISPWDSGLPVCSLTDSFVPLHSELLHRKELEILI